MMQQKIQQKKIFFLIVYEKNLVLCFHLRTLRSKNERPNANVTYLQTRLSVFEAADGN